MVKGKTESGFEYQYNEAIAQDWEFMKHVGAFKSDEKIDAMVGMQKAVAMLLGDQEEKLIEHVKSKNNGFAPFEEVMKEFNEILEGNKTTKN